MPGSGERPGLRDRRDVLGVLALAGALPEMVVVVAGHEVDRRGEERVAADEREAHEVLEDHRGDVVERQRELEHVAAEDERGAARLSFFRTR